MSSEIKNTIGILCKLINFIYEASLKPEYFRLAKFNKTDENVVMVLWNTLRIILKENSSISVQQSLYNLNYTRKEFHGLNPTLDNGSRELLLALVFIISLNLEKDLQNRLDTSFPDDCGTFSATSEAIAPKGPFDLNRLKESDLRNYKKWLQGKISSNNIAMAEYNDQIGKIQEKYNKKLDLKAHSSLSVYEILALKNKEIGKQFLQDTELLVKLMNIYSEWRKRERQFWKWMSTVLEEAKKPAGLAQDTTSL